MNIDTEPKPASKQLPDAAEETTMLAVDAAKDAVKSAATTTKDATNTVEDAVGKAVDFTKESASHVADKAKEVYSQTAIKAEETIACSKNYVRQHPLSVVIGAVAFGATLGCLVMWSRRKPTFGERYEDEPLLAVRDAILGAIAPITDRVHQGYDSAMDGAGKAVERIHRFGAERNSHSISNKIGRFGNHLKFW